MMYLDLAEIDQVLSLSRFWSRKKRAAARFDRNDFFQFNIPARQEKLPPSLKDTLPITRANSSLSTDVADLDLAVRRAVNHALNFYPLGPIRLLTNLRYFGYSINPITCYYCFSAESDQDHLLALLIEVTNTPWGEKTHYVLDLRNYSPKERVDFQKAMHVSPFMGMEMDYQWRGNLPGEILQYSLGNIHRHSPAEGSGPGDRVFEAGVKFKRTEITGSSLNKIMFRYPFMTMKVALGIYWQALRLTLKRVSVVPHPKSRMKVRKHDPN